MIHKQNIYLGRLIGIPVSIDYSWFFIFVLLTWMLATSYFPAEFKDWSPVLYWVIGAITSILLFVSVLLHELGHSIVAIKYKIPVREITLLVFGGVSQISGEPRSAMAEFWIAIAGPFVSFFLSALFYLILPLISGIEVVYSIVKYLAYINIILGIFNLIPGFPLDGGRILRAIIWGITHNMRKATVIAGNVGRIIAFLFIYFGIMEIFAGRVADGLWIIFIAWFLESAATAQIQQQQLRSILTLHHVSEAMNRNFAVLLANMSIEELMKYHIIGAGRRSAIVEDVGTPVGLVTLHHIQKVPPEKWETTTVADIMLPLSESERINAADDLWKALEKMDYGGVNQLPVFENGQLVGVLTRENLVSFLKAIDQLKS